MRFSDPAGQYIFRLPLGWAYDPDGSHLITVAFARWDDPSATLSVRALPTLAPANAPPEAWYAEAARDAPGPPRMVRCGGAVAVRVDADDEARRLLCVRGPRIDVLVDHRGEAGRSDPLAAICRTLEVPANRMLPRFADQAQVLTDLQVAIDATVAGDWDAVFEPAVRAHAAATSTYLWSIAGNAFHPEIPAIIAVVDALMLIGRAASSLPHLRDAEHLAARARVTNAHLPFLPSQRRGQMDDGLWGRYVAAADLQAVLTGVDEPSRSTTMLAMERVPIFERQGQEFAERQSYDAAVQAFELAVTDQLLLLGTVAREDPDGVKVPDALPESFLAVVRNGGVDDPEAQQAIAADVARAVRVQQFEALTRLLPQLAFARTMIDDIEGGIEANGFAVSIADRLVVEQQAEPEAVKRERPDPRIGKVLALLQHAAGLQDVGDEPSLNDANAFLAQAEALLDELGEEEGLRAWACLLRVSLMHEQRVTDNVLEIIDRGLSAAAREGNAAEETAVELKGMKSLYLGMAGRQEEAEQILAEVVASPEGDGPRDKLRRANHFLNLAIVQYQRDQREDAVASLAQSARRLVQVAPFGEEALRTFVIGSRTLVAELALAYSLNLAATAVLDARRGPFADEALRVGVAEAQRRREIYADLVQRLLDVGFVDEAIAAADRSRARSLLETLAPEARSEEPAGPPQLPDLDGVDPRETLGRCADHVVMSASALLEQRGAARPLEADQLRALVAQLDATALVLQPVHGRLALLVARPSGDIEAVYSPIALEVLLDASAGASAALRIFSVPRGAPAPPPAATRGDPLDDALARLWEGIVAPVAGWLEPDRPLVVVPYRETALVPFGLLREPGGQALIERHPISLAPSLATLHALRRRGSWRRRRPTRAYLAADPAIAGRFRGAGLGDLAGARAEAAEIASLLRARGVRADELTVLEGAAADEASYTTRARGCDLVHLACHATLNEPASASCLYLAADGSDGQLLVSEIAQVPLDDALVFLAACDSGQGRPTADGVIGVGRAFLEAGARSVVMSLWKVADAATSVLCGHFYRALLDEERECNAAEALQTAMILTRADLQAGRISDEQGRVLDARDAYWAPFTLVGDAMAIQYTGEQRRDHE